MTDSPPPKRHCPSKSFTTYIPTKNYSPHISHSPSHSTISYCYPLSLLPLATIRVYQSREFRPLRVPCRNCAHPAEIGLVLQKMFLTVERLVSGGAGKLAQKEKNEENHWAVNYEAGILEPPLFGAGGFKSGRLADSPYFPFEGGRAVEELGLFIRGLYGIVLDGDGGGGSGIAKGKGREARFETPRKLSKASRRTTPSVSPSPMFSPTFMSPPPSRHSETPAGTPEEEGAIPDFNNLRVLFSLLDKLERGSFAAAQMTEAFADVVIGQRCDNCRGRTAQKPGAQASPVSSGIVAPGGEVDFGSEDDSSSKTVSAERTPPEYALSLEQKNGPTLQSTPEEYTPPSTSINDPTAKTRDQVIRTLCTPERGNGANPEGSVLGRTDRWYASITPRAEKRIRRENPGEDVKAMIKEEEEEED